MPGGILGSLSLFDALVAINSQLYCDPEFSRTKETKIRARLIALAVGTLRSQYRRELICAVFGLLCLLGRAAETTPREDEFGRPLPTSDLMGYNALGIVFGPLLVGDILGSHAVKLSDPTTGLFLVAATPSPKSKKERKKSKETLDETQGQQTFLDVDKIHVANDITEMLITNWRDVVRQMRNMDGGMGILRRRSRSSVSNHEPKRSRGFLRSSENDAAAGKGTFDRHVSEEHPPSPGSPGHRECRALPSILAHSANKHGEGAVSYSQMDNKSDFLSVKRTRPNSTQVVSNSRQSTAAVAALSPPQEESIYENAAVSPVGLSTPRKSSLRSCGRQVPEMHMREDPANDENFSLSPDELSCPSRPSSKRTSRHFSNETSLDSQFRQQISVAPMETYKSSERTEESHAFACAHRCRSAMPNEKRPTTPKTTTQVDGSPERPQPSADLNPIIAYQAGPGMRILKAPSTLRSQPKTCQVEAGNEPTLNRSCDQKTQPRGAEGSEATDDKAVKKSSLRSRRGKFSPDQMDGAVDFLMQSSYRGSFMDLRSEFERRDTVNNQKPFTSVSKVRPQQHAVLTKKNGQSRKSSWSSSRRSTPKSTKNERDEIEPVASKVRGLAAMFDTAAKASPFLPTPGGVIEKMRRETARVISPYTSNPSPRVSLKSPTSSSTPVSLMNPSRISIDLTNAANSNRRKSLIPRMQKFSPTDRAETTERHTTPMNVRRDESRLSLASFNTPSRIPTPTRVQLRNKPPGADLPDLPQLDGSHKTASKSPLKLTAQQEILPVGYYSSSIPGNRTIGGYKGLPRLSRHSTTSDFRESIGHSGESSPLDPNLSQGRSASSLRDQIRNLRVELSARNEECVQLRLELEEYKKTQQRNESLLRDDLDRARADNSNRRRRAEFAEQKVDKFERLAIQIEDVRDRSHFSVGYRHFQSGDAADDYSFASGSDHLDTAYPTPQAMTVRINQSIRRTPSASRVAANGANSGGGDGVSECSSSTVVRNVAAGPVDDGVGLWDAVDELVDFASPKLIDDYR